MEGKCSPSSRRRAILLKLRSRYVALLAASEGSRTLLNLVVLVNYLGIELMMNKTT